MRLLLSTLAWTLLCLMVGISAAAAQQPGRTYKIGFLEVGRLNLVVPPIEQWTA
jgi:hypothetical protein